jgi:hypothetical protein
MIADAFSRFFLERPPELREASRIEVYPDTLQVLVPFARVGPPDGDLESFLALLATRTPTGMGVRLKTGSDDIRIVIPCRHLQRGGATKIVRAGARAPTAADPALIRALLQSHRLAAELGGAPVGAPERGLLRASPPGQYERNLLPLAFMAPGLQEAILAGEQPAGLTLQALIETPLPICWTQQRRWFAAFH